MALTEAFIRRYGDTFHGDLAKVQLEEMKKAQAERKRVAMLEQQRKEASDAEAKRPGRVFRDCTAICPELVVIPAGSFMMGSNDHDTELPLHRVTFAKAFALGIYAVNFEEWDVCVAAGGCKTLADDLSRR